MTDPINPPHYKFGKIEVIDAIDDWQLGFCLGNVIKYVARADHKNNAIEDLKKAAWYLNHEITKREAAKRKGNLLEFAATAGGVGHGLVLADFLDRYVATKKPKKAKNETPWYSRHRHHQLLGDDTNPRKNKKKQKVRRRRSKRP